MDSGAQPVEFSSHFQLDDKQITQLRKVSNWMHRRFACWNFNVEAGDLFSMLYIAMAEDLCDMNTPWKHRVSFAIKRVLNELNSKRHSYSYKRKFPHISLEFIQSMGFDIRDDGELVLPSGINANDSLDQQFERLSADRKGFRGG